ncbi:AAA family ATPase [Clostridium chromiireducens]|uniref:AAA family ATPase n=1 Tax=Clostridium chromiireducens TaxID=225345 RepID=A0A1V4ICG3_9CLOT|nr:AAA family ATPase [Clostridium chromiireducens]OPJ57623.1 putative AAA-ATPase [Clostridium chromiireducens]RII34090.1 AAA family ATPase [Clostridium chromiireducens]
MKKIPIGISDFKTLIEEDYLFVDKSELIKEFWESNGQTILVPRPRRFGKTLNMSMLRYFFENSNEDNNYLFKGLEIENHKDIMELQGKYPVIYLTFKDEKYSSFEYLQAGLRNILGKLYQDHKYCLNADKMDAIDKKYYNSITNKEADIIDLSNTLKKLSEYLYDYYGKKVIILIDEYDVPIQASYINNYYNEAIEFMRNLLSGAFKDNNSLQKGMITGILRVARESIFSGLNNLKVESILSYNLSDKFGFTDSEIEQLVSDYNIKEELNNIKDWYNGYYFGETTIYNPWSILNYLSSPKAGLKPYWVNSSSNDLVGILLSKGSNEVKKNLEDLVNGNNIEKVIDENIVMEDIEKSADNLWSFLLFTGYLKVNSKKRKGLKDYYTLSIPNLEVTTLYYDLIEKWFEDTITKENYELMINSLINGDIKIFGKLLRQFVLKSISYFDVGGYEGEKVYHAFVLGMLISLNDTHEVLSNRESGYGRYDVMIIPKDISKLGIVIEFKKLDPDDDETLEETADIALKQISDKKYITTLEARGINNMKEIAIVFKGKELYIKER